MANKALEYLQLEESLGRPPSLKEFGKGGFEYRAAEAGLGTDAEVAWTEYERIVRDVLVRTEGVSREDDHYEHRESPTERSIDENEIAGPRPTYDVSTQRQPESKPEKSWWRRLFGR